MKKSFAGLIGAASPVVPRNLNRSMPKVKPRFSMPRRRSNRPTTLHGPSVQHSALESDPIDSPARTLSLVQFHIHCAPWSSPPARTPSSPIKPVVCSTRLTSCEKETLRNVTYMDVDVDVDVKCVFFFPSAHGLVTGLSQVSRLEVNVCDMTVCRLGVAVIRHGETRSTNASNHVSHYQATT